MTSGARGILLAILSLAAALLSGCAGEPDALVEARAGDVVPSLSFRPPAVALEGCTFTDCYEPTIASDPEGRLFVADGSTGPVAVSEDGGATWTPRDPPPMPDGLEGRQGDVLLQVSPSGRLHWSALVVASTPTGGLLFGIQVAWSDDGARTWAGDVHLAPTTLAPQVVYPDRQWLGFAPDGTLYVTYNQVPTGIWIARSDDGGESWTGWTRAAPLEQRQAGAGQSGPPVVDSQGRVFVPACRSALGGPTQVFRSEDRGATFTPVLVGDACSWFPILAVAPDDTLVLASQPGGPEVFSSADGGLTFSEGQAWGRGASAAVWPLPGADGQLALAWFDGQADLRVARGTLAGGPVDAAVAGAADGSGQARTPARTDFASMARLPDGRLSVAMVDGDRVLVSVQA